MEKIQSTTSEKVTYPCDHARKRMCKEVDGIEEIYIRLLSQIGHPIDQPLVASIQDLPEKSAKLKSAGTSKV